MTKGDSLEYLLAPVSLGSFFSNYMDRRPLYVERKNSGYYGDLISLAGINNLISSGGISYPSLQLAKNGEYISPGHFAIDVDYGGVTIGGILDVDMVASEFRSGSTLVLNAVNRYFHEVALLCQSIVSKLTCTISANIYATPPNSFGFSPHFDMHDVYTLQICGRKTWKVYFPSVQAPLKNTNTELPPDLGLPIMTAILAPGDLLYLPRGYIHEAASLDETSVHLTIGVMRLTWYDILREALRLCEDDVRYRTFVPITSSNVDNIDKGLGAEYEKLIAEMSRISPRSVMDSIIKRGDLEEAFRLPVAVEVITHELRQNSKTT